MSSSLSGAIARGSWAPRRARLHVGTFEVNAENPRHGLIERPPHRFNRPDHVVAWAGNEGRQESGSAEGAMGPADCGNGRRCRRVVEHHAAAAVDLEVDEPGRQCASREPRDARSSGDRVLRHDVADGAALQQQGTAGDETFRRVQPGAGQGFHRLSSSLRRETGSPARGGMLVSVRRSRNRV